MSTNETSIRLYVHKKVISNTISTWMETKNGEVKT